MNFIEKLMLALLAQAEAEVPVFVHSAQGIVVLNATEPIVNGLVASLATPAVIQTPATGTVTPITQTATPAAEVTP